MKNEIIVFWQDECLPVVSSGVVIEADSFPVTELYTLERYEHVDGMSLRGKAFNGDCISVHESVAVSGGRNYRIKNYDVANCRPIEEMDVQRPFESYFTRLVLMRAFIGDQFIEDDDPEVDKIVYKSEDLAVLCKMVPFDDEVGSPVVLFENEFVRIAYDRNCSELHTLYREGSDYSYSLSFEFKQPVRLSWAEHDWVNSITNLLSVVLGGDIIADDVVFYSKRIGAEFRRFSGQFGKREERHQPKIEKMLFPFSNMKDELAAVISAWMERPNTLRGIADVYPHARYRNPLGNVRFALSMRLAEAAYADSVVADVVSSERIGRLPDGVIDLGNNALRPIKRIVKRLSSSHDYPFKEKLVSLGNRFDEVYRSARLRIDWDECAKVCKSIRDAEAHGTLLGGLPQVEHDKMYALEQAALLFYELSVLDLFPIEDEAKRIAQQRLFKFRRRNISVVDFWPNAHGANAR